MTTTHAIELDRIEKYGAAQRPFYTGARCLCGNWSMSLGWTQPDVDRKRRMQESFQSHVETFMPARADLSALRVGSRIRDHS